MEHWLQNRFEISPYHHLRDAIRYGRNSQRPWRAISLWDLHAPHGRRNIAARGQPVPESIEVITQVLFELGNRLTIDARRTAICLHPLKRFPHLAFGNI